MVQEILQMLFPSIFAAVDTLNHIAISAEKGSSGSDRTSACFIWLLVQLAAVPPGSCIFAEQL